MFKIMILALISISLISSAYADRFSDYNAAINGVFSGYIQGAPSICGSSKVLSDLQKVAYQIDADKTLSLEDRNQLKSLIVSKILKSKITDHTQLFNDSERPGRIDKMKDSASGFVLEYVPTNIQSFIGDFFDLDLRIAKQYTLPSWEISDFIFAAYPEYKSDASCCNSGINNFELVKKGIKRLVLAKKEIYGFEGKEGYIGTDLRKNASRNSWKINKIAECAPCDKSSKKDKAWALEFLNKKRKIAEKAIKEISYLKDFAFYSAFCEALTEELRPDYVIFDIGIKTGCRYHYCGREIRMSRDELDQMGLSKNLCK